MSDHGDGHLPAQFGFARVWDDPAFKAAYSRIEAKLPRLDFAPTAFALEDRALIPEGIAFDAKSRGLFVGSIAKRNILRVDANRAVTEFAGAAADLDAVLGVAVDSPRRKLHAVSTSARTTAGEERLRNAVVAFAPNSSRRTSCAAATASRGDRRHAIQPRGNHRRGGGRAEAGGATRPASALSGRPRKASRCPRGSSAATATAPSKGSSREARGARRVAARTPR